MRAIMTEKIVRTLVAGLAAAVSAAAAATPVSAANKEHQQLMADIRMLQEQSQQLQLLLGQLGEALKAVNARLDDQSNATRKAFADEKLTIDTLSSDLRVVREKVDDNNVRVSSLTQELEALRQGVTQMTAPRPTTTEPDTSLPPGTAPAAAPPPATLGVSPNQLWDNAFSDYTSGQYDLAIQGFDAYIRDFPKSDKADDAQVYIGRAYMFDNKFDKAIEAFDKAIRTYPAGDTIPDAYYQKGIALRRLRQEDRAREAFDACVKDAVKKLPQGEQSSVAIMCRQALTSR
jgi:TolA-binding protein